MSVGWSELQPELLETIGKKLTIYIDYLRFRAVCHNWRSSVPNTANHLPSQLPWLMLPQSSSRHQHRRAFFSLSENKFHFLNLPEVSHPKHHCGSSNGWLAIVDESPTIFLLNPLTNVKFYLPPLSTFPIVVDFNFSRIGREYTLRDSYGVFYSHNLIEMRDSFIKKVVLSSSPSSDDKFIALAILNHSGDLAFCRNGDNCWSFIDDAQSFSEDAVFYDGQFYGVNRLGRIAVCDVSGASPTVSIIETPGKMGGDMKYLVNCGGELLLVLRFLEFAYYVEPDELDKICKTINFLVYRLNSSELRWERVENLGDRALFLGENSSLCMSASDFSGCKGNCIYFTDDYSESSDDCIWGDYDLGIFNMGDGAVEPLTAYPLNSPSRLLLPPPIWLTPNPR